MTVRSNRQLSPQQMQYWQTIQDGYHQQLVMCELRRHKVDNLILCIHQPWLRPIVRGIATADIELDARFLNSLDKEYAIIEQLDWNTSGDQQTFIERYKERHGFYLKWILADMIHRNRKNRQYCVDLGFRMNGPNLGCIPKTRKCTKI